MEMDNPVIQQLVEAQKQMLSMIQGMQNQTLNIIQQNTTALQNAQNAIQTPINPANQAGNFSQNQQGLGGSVDNIGDSLTNPSMMSSFFGNTGNVSGTNILPNMFMPGAQSLLPGMMGNQPSMNVPSPSIFGTVDGSSGLSYQSLTGPAVQEFQQMMSPIAQEMQDALANPADLEQYRVGKVHGVGLGFLTQRHLGFKGYQSSVEAQENFIYNTSGAVERNLLGMAGTVSSVGAGLLGSFGLGPIYGTGIGLGVGLMIDQTIKGATTASTYEELLRKNANKFFTPLESTNEFGRPGFKRDELHDASEFLRKLSIEEFLSDTEMQRIVESGAHDKLLKSSTDLESFKRKVKDLTNAVKNYMTAFDLTIEESSKLMGEFERKGISPLSNQAYLLGGQISSASKLSGLSMMEGMQKIFSTADSITQGTAMNAAGVINTTAFNLASANMLYDGYISKIDPYMKQYTKSMGGAAELGLSNEQMFRGYVNQNSDMFLSMYATAFEKDESTGRFILNQGKMNELLSSGRSVADLQGASTSYFNAFSEEDKLRLQQLSDTQFQDFMNSGPAMTKMIRQMLDNQKSVMGVDVDDTTGLQMMFGIEYERAESMRQQLEYNSNPAVALTIGAQALSDTLSAKLEPGMIEKLTNTLRSASAETFGDLGQRIHNFGSDQLVKMTSWVENIPYRGKSGEFYDYSDPSVREELFSQKTQNEIEKSLQGVGQYLQSKGFKSDLTSIDMGTVNTQNFKKQELSFEQMEIYGDKIMDGTVLGTAEVAFLKGVASSNETGEVSRKRAQQLLDYNSGKVSKSDYRTFEAKEELYMENQGEYYDPATGQTVKVDNKQTTVDLTDLREEVKKNKGNLETQRGNLEKILGDLVTNADIGSDQDSIEKNAMDLQLAVRTGDTDTINRIVTDPQKAKYFLNLAEEYKTYGKQEGELTKSIATLQSQEDYAEGLISSSLSMRNIFDVFTDKDKPTKETNKKIKGLEKNAAALKKALEDGDQATIDTLSKTLLEDTSGLLDSMTYDQNKTMIEMLNSSGFNIDESGATVSFYNEDNSINREAVKKQMLKWAARSQGAEASVTGEGVEGEKEASKALGEHEKAFGELVSTMQNEIQMMRNARNGRPVYTNINKNSGPGG